ncbi:cytochrome oxidase biogenesis protein [Synechococcus sp. A18-46.1]|nr:cytochrome oxidase biogenesis protein [Synechococcus sp. A18-46.1]
MRRRLGRLSSHLLVAVIALVVIGGATRVMEAGLACPDWPLCYGTFLPGRQMNLQVFLEWFHRLDAFVIGIALVVMSVVSVVWRRSLPRWLPWMSGLLVLLVVLQGGLGALTVLQLLPSGVVTAHLALALTLVALLSGLTQRLLQSGDGQPPWWWRPLSALALVGVVSQCLLGARMATSWAAQRCLAGGEACRWLVWHRSAATPVAGFVLLFVLVALLAGGWSRRQWPLLLSAVLLVTTQVSLGITTLRLGLDQPLVTVAHQLVAALLVGVLAALLVRCPAFVAAVPCPVVLDDSSLEPCHG